MSQHFDVFAPPGMFTARGSCVSIDSTDRLYIGHGSRAVTIDLKPLQWQLLSAALVRLSNHQCGPVLIETEVASLHLSMARLYLVIKASDRSGTVTVALSRGEANELHRAARRRSPQATTIGN